MSISELRNEGRKKIINVQHTFETMHKHFATNVHMT